MGKLIVSDLTIVAPRLPPHACGVGTYAYELSRHWPNRDAQRFLVLADSAATSRDHFSEATITGFLPERKSFADGLQRHATGDVLLHYAGRAYQRFGYPRWMPVALAEWQGRDPAHRLHIIFHELPAHFPLLSKQGVLQRLSCSVARKLAQQATTIVTNSEHHAALLKNWAPAVPVDWFPVPSNIPPPRDATSGADNWSRGEFAIFGLPYTRWQTLLLYRDWISAWQKSGRLTKLHLIGPRDEKFSPQADAILVHDLPREMVIEHGSLAPEQVSRVLAESEFCLSSTSDLTWSKSGTFMACAAHGCAVVTAQKFTIPPLEYTVAAQDLTETSEEAARVKGTQLRNWYDANADWELTAARIASLVNQR